MMVPLLIPSGQNPQLWTNADPNDLVCNFLVHIGSQLEICSVWVLDDAKNDDESYDDDDDDIDDDNDDDGGPED